MKRIFIIRHSKSSWSDISLRDIDRPLNGRGKKDAPLMARILFQKGYKIDHIFLSPSRRTHDSAAYYIKEHEVRSKNIVVEDSLYHGYPEDYENTIYGLAEDKNNVAFFGHNPGITILINNCIGRPIDNVPTSGIVVLESEAPTWQKFNFESSVMKDYIYPKQYK
jgi:phosphohistidine phosphatase